MNEDNQISIWGYNDGAKVLKVDFRPADVQGGGRKAADAGAMLWAASWRPDGSGRFTDRPASPPPRGVKRVKGLPADSTSGGGAFKPKGGGGLAAAMMRGEVPVAAENSTTDRGWATEKTPQLTWQEQQQQQKDYP